MIKPDGVQRQLVGEIISRFERKGLVLKSMKMLVPDRSTVERHYAAHAGKPFFDAIVSNVSSASVVAMIWEGPEAITLARKLMGATKPADSAPGTIRGDFASTTELNLIHGSDSPEAAAEEISIWFN